MLVLRTPVAEQASGDTTIAWRVVADGPDRSRVLLRWRSASAGAFADTVDHLIGPVSYLMERKELAIADRASRP